MSSPVSCDHFDCLANHKPDSCRWGSLVYALILWKLSSHKVVDAHKKPHTNEPRSEERAKGNRKNTSCVLCINMDHNCLSGSPHLSFSSGVHLQAKAYTLLEGSNGQQAQWGVYFWANLLRIVLCLLPIWEQYANMGIWDIANIANMGRFCEIQSHWTQ